MELLNTELFFSFLEKNLKNPAFDADAYLEKLIIHWGETGETTFTLPAEETVSGTDVAIAFAAKTRYFIRENGQEIPVEDLENGYDIYRPVLEFTSAEAVVPIEIPVQAQMNPIALIRHKSGKSLGLISKLSAISPEKLLAYEKPGYDIGSIPLSEAAAISKALNVHAEDLLTIAPTAPKRLGK